MYLPFSGRATILSCGFDNELPKFKVKRYEKARKKYINIERFFKVASIIVTG